MTMTKEMYMDEIEQVGVDFAFERLTRDEALDKLAHLGIRGQEAEDLLDEAVG